MNKWVNSTDLVSEWWKPRMGPENAQDWKLTNRNPVQRASEKGLWPPLPIHLLRRSKKIRDLQEWDQAPTLASSDSLTTQSWWPPSRGLVKTCPCQDQSSQLYVSHVPLINSLILCILGACLFTPVNINCLWVICLLILTLTLTVYWNPHFNPGNISREINYPLTFTTAWWVWRSGCI